jgi:hypothetical protein
VDRILSGTPEGDDTVRSGDVIAVVRCGEVILAGGSGDGAPVGGDHPASDVVELAVAAL